MSAKRLKPRKNTTKAPVVKDPKWDKTFSKVNKFCSIAVIVLVYILAIFAGLYQELNIYVMESNVASTEYAYSIIEDTNAIAGDVLAGVEHLEVKVPRGTGNFVAVFNEEGSEIVGEVWVVEEMTLWESIKSIALFTTLDILVFLITLWIVRKYFEKYKWRICALCVYQIIFIMVAWVMHSYAWSVLFGDAFTYVSGAYTIIRLLALSIVMAMFDKSPSIKEKKNHSSK